MTWDTAGDLGQEPLEEHSSQSLESCHVLENEPVLSLLIPDSPVLQTVATDRPVMLPSVAKSFM